MFSKRLQCLLSDSTERLTCLWLSIQIGCDKVGGEKPHSSVVLSFPPVWIAINKITKKALTSMYELLRGSHTEFQSFQPDRAITIQKKPLLTAKWVMPVCSLLYLWNRQKVGFIA